MSRTLPEEASENVRRNCEDHPEAAALRQRLVSSPDVRLVSAADDWLIDFVPAPDVKRALLVHEGVVPHGCPIHRGGRYVFTDSADPFEPYRLTCPTGGEHYPNEDFPESGNVSAPWDEQGWLDVRQTTEGAPNPTHGLRYHFNAHYAYWGRWMKLGPLMEQLAVAHVLSEPGDPLKARLARAAAVLLLRLTAVFPLLKREDFRSAAGVRDFPFTVKIMDYVWEPGHTNQYALSFDYVRDAILADGSLLGLDYGRSGVAWGDDPAHDLDGDGQVTTADLVVWVEQDLLRAYGELYAEIPPIYANATIVHQKTLSLLAVVLDEARYFEHARRILMDHIATNWYTNDGAYYEGAIPGYGQFGLKALRDATGWLRRFDPNLTSGRVVKGYLFGPSMVCLGRTLPNNDDSGGVTLDRLSGGPGFDVGEYERAFLDYEDVRILEAVSRDDGAEARRFESPADLMYRPRDAEQKALRRARLTLNGERPGSCATRAGYAVLRGGTAETPFDLFVTFDGQAGSHTHFDTFSPILYGYDRVLVPDLGYPPELRGPSRHDWIGHPLSHWTVTVDRRSMNPDFERGQLKLLAERPGFHAFSGSAPTSYAGVAERFERTLLLVDKPDGTPLVIDFFRVTGGREHLYSFHGAAPDGADAVTVTGGDLASASEYETLQGMWHNQAVSYARPMADSEDRCLAYVVAPRAVRPDPSAGALRFRMPRGDAEGTVLDLWMPTKCAEEYVVAEGRREPVAGRGHARLPYVVARSGHVTNDREADTVFCSVVEAHRGEGAVEAVALDEETGVLSIRFSDGVSWLVRTDLESAILTVIGRSDRIRRALSARLATVGMVKRADYAVREMELDEVASFAEGEVLLIENEAGRNTFYPVDRVEHGRIRLGDRWTDLCVARGHLTGPRDGARLSYDADYRIQDPIRAQCRGGRLVDGGGRSARVLGIDSAFIYLEPTGANGPAPPAGAEADGARRFEVFDFGVGDTVKRVTITDTQAT